MKTVRIIDVCSGKGGVGKTTISANLGLALQKFGRRVAVVDCNLTTSHLSLCFGMGSYPKTLNSFLRNESRIEEVTYHHPSGLKVVPASLELADLVDIDATNLRGRLTDAFRDYDVLLLDSAPGIGKEALIAMKAADNVLFVATPHIPSVVDVLKCHQLIRETGGSPAPLGVILNRVRNRRYEVSQPELSQFVELPIIGSVPEDERVLESTNGRTLVTFSRPYAPSSVSMFDIAARMVGAPYRRPSRARMFVENLKRNGRHDAHAYQAAYGRPYGMI